jgi:hypothetical protein
MTIYNQTANSKRFLSGVLIGVLIGPAIYLFTLGHVVPGVLLPLIYLAFETFRIGVIFDFELGQFSKFQQVLYLIKIPLGKPKTLSSFSHYRLVFGHDDANISANWAQSTSVSQDYYTLSLWNTEEERFTSVLKCDYDKLQALLQQLEESHIYAVDEK